MFTVLLSLNQNILMLLFLVIRLDFGGIRREQLTDVIKYDDLFSKYTSKLFRGSLECLMD